MFSKSQIPLYFSKDLKLGSSTPLVVHGKPYVLWKNSTGQVSLLSNRCPHRGARLSDGKVHNVITCPYHGWEFDTNGACVNIPQMPNNKNFNIPKACNALNFTCTENDGIIWASLDSTSKSSTSIIKSKYLSSEKKSEYFVTDYFFNAPYSYFLQAENLLDPAHIHFVHDGFQGNSRKGCPLKVSKLKERSDELAAYFEHDSRDKNLPDIYIRFNIPYNIEVSIYNNENKIVRKNIIYMYPTTDTTCNVLFRDVALKKYISPKSLSLEVDLFINVLAPNLVNAHYDLINKTVVDKIMDQDVYVLKGQQELVPLDTKYLDTRYVLPTESDKLILAFRKYLKQNMVE